MVITKDAVRDFDAGHAYFRRHCAARGPWDQELLSDGHARAIQVTADLDLLLRGLRRDEFRPQPSRWVAAQLVANGGSVSSDPEDWLKALGSWPVLSVVYMLAKAPLPLLRNALAQQRLTPIEWFLTADAAARTSGPCWPWPATASPSPAAERENGR